MLAIIDYGVGNLNSIRNMLKKTGYNKAVITADHEEIESAEKIIIPGVGHFDYGMRQLNGTGLVPLLNKKAMTDRTPVLGICLGAQLLTKKSEEGGEPGLGWIEGQTVKFDESRMNHHLKIPNMGWCDVSVDKESALFDGMFEDPRFYFVHTYHLICQRDEDILTSANYGYAFTAGFERGNIMGVQFHPEKSHKFGMKLLANFVEHY